MIRPRADQPKCPRPTWRSRTRVETIGRKIIAQNTFTGIEPLFHTVGVPEAVLFHRGAEELIISEGLVKQCRNDSELAAVLSSELAQMMNEKKTARRVGAGPGFLPGCGSANRLRSRRWLAD